jgi:hypothetical protein
VAWWLEFVDTDQTAKAYTPFFLASMNTVAKKVASAMKMLTKSIDIRRLNSIGLTGLSMAFVDTVRRVDTVWGVICLLIVTGGRLSIKLSDRLAKTHFIVERYSLDLIILSHELIPFLMYGLLNLLKRATVKIFKVLEKIFAICDKAHYLDDKFCYLMP